VSAVAQKAFHSSLPNRLGLRTLRAEMFGVGAIDPRIDALAYRLDLEREE
jgi:hypothetical protein